MQEYALTNSGDWRNYAFFNDLHYVRNLVALDEDFEVIVSTHPACTRRRIPPMAVGGRERAMVAARMVAELLPWRFHAAQTLQASQLCSQPAYLTALAMHTGQDHP
jgi:hypothetical protein